MKIIEEKTGYTLISALSVMLVVIVLAMSAAAQEVAVPFGQWVQIGGADSQQNEIFREILSQRTGRGQTATSMSVMVQHLK